MIRTARRTGQYIRTARGTIRSQVRVDANGHTGTVVSVNRTDSGRVVVGIEWDDMDVNIWAQRNGIAFITRPHLAHHRDVEALQILA